jgi:hypothetical protein
MLILISIALLGFGLLLFSFGVAVWLIGLAISNLPSNLPAMAMSLGVMRTKTACWPHSGPPKP